MSAIWLSFKKALKFARKLKLNSVREWVEYCSSGKRPKNIPAQPQTIYVGQGWQGWKYWLGTDWPSFEEASKAIRKLGLKNCDEWKDFCSSGKRPTNIPSNPQTTYKGKGWKGWRYWLGTDRWSFEKARAFVRKLELKSVYEWRQYRSKKGRSFNIPFAPALYYKEWVDWNDWLGVTCHLKKQFLSFEDARDFAAKLNLEKQTEWFRYWSLNKRPEDIPTNPNQVYKDKGWTTWGDFLGNGNIHPGTKQFLSFEDARVFARGIGLKKCREWGKYVKSGSKPVDIPSLPERIYAKCGWSGYPDWLDRNLVKDRG